MKIETITKILFLFILIVFVLPTALAESYPESDAFKEASKTQIGVITHVEGDGTYIARQGEMISDPPVGTKIYCNDNVNTQNSNDVIKIRNIKTDEEITLTRSQDMALFILQQGVYMGVDMPHMDKFKGFICVEPRGTDGVWGAGSGKGDGWLSDWKSKVKKKVEKTLKKCREDEDLVDGECVYKCEFDEKYVDGECIPDVPLAPNQYEMIEIDGKKVAHFIDVYGNDMYTSDGKHFYNDYGKAAAMGPIRKGWNAITETPGNIFDFFFKTKLKDPERQLQMDVAREVMQDFKRADMKSLEEKHGKYAEHLKKLIEVTAVAETSISKPVKALVSVPADSIIKMAQEADETEFGQGVLAYIKERESGKSQNHLYDDTPEVLSGVGGMKGVSHSLASRYPKAFLFTKYEEAYQRYKIAKEFNRE